MIKGRRSINYGKLIATVVGEC